MKKIGFNFSPRHRFEYIMKDSIIKYHQDNEIVDVFFRKDKNSGRNGVDNLALVIVNNGAGKSTLLNFILDGFTIENTLIQGIFIFSDDNKIKIYYNIPDEAWLEYFTDKYKRYKVLQNMMGKLEKYRLKNLECFVGHNDKAIDKCINDLQKTHFIFYSNIFTDKYWRVVKAKGVSNISTVGLIESDMSYAYEM
ncbi:hypothetical protein [Clostridium sp.]|uniref:hypothetical protein n=1 Tax=Clostridium sp. TaxID=1506 RepID=UPI003216D64D